MGLEEAIAALLDLRQGAECGDEAWQAARGRFAYALFAGSDEQAIREAVALDASDTLPVDLKRAAYERLIELSGREPRDLQSYAWYLQLHGPEWDDYARSLLDEAGERVGTETGNEPRAEWTKNSA